MLLYKYRSWEARKLFKCNKLQISFMYKIAVNSLSNTVNRPYLTSYGVHIGNIHSLFVVYNRDHATVDVHLSTIITNKTLKEKPGDKLKKITLKPLFHKIMHQNRRNIRYGKFYKTYVVVKRMKIGVGKLRVLQFKLGRV